MSVFAANGIKINFADDDNDRIPFVFQHGLGADISQPMSFFLKDHPFRLISLDCRGHGKTIPLGDRQRGKELFLSTCEYQTALRSSPANAASLIWQFLRARADETFDILESIPNDIPVPEIASWKKMGVPTLVLACRNDLLHPFEYGQVLAREIPGARFAEITAKAISEEKHVEDVRREIFQFIEELGRHS